MKNDFLLSFRFSFVEKAKKLKKNEGKKYTENENSKIQSHSRQKIFNFV